MKPYFNDEQWEFIYDLHYQGYTYKELAEWLGISHGTIQYNFYRLGFKSFRRKPLDTYNKVLASLGGKDHATQRR